jgi:disulfide bond formation protein DsbB
MDPLVSAVNLGLGIVTIIAQVLSLVLLVSLIIFYTQKKVVFPLNLFGRYALWAGFIVALTATSGSLFYSEVAGFTPCIFCWYQRIMMYPQVIIFGLALWKKDFHIVDYPLALSVVGALLAGYHYWMQFAANPLSPCSAIGFSVSCSQRFVTTLGYITIPMMALSAFLLIGLTMLARKATISQQ